MSDLIRIIPAEPKLSPEFELPLAHAKAIVNSGSGIWKGRKTVCLTPDRNKKVSWVIRQSGYAGPLVQQVAT